MSKSAILSLLFAVVLISTVAALVPKHLRNAELTPAELAQKLPVAPDDSCPRAQRVLEDSEAKAPVRLPNALTADEAAIYMAVVERWNAESRSPLNVSRRTIPLYQNIGNCECLKDIELESLARATRSFRFLPRALESRSIRLVDAETQSAIVQTNDPENTIRNGGSVDSAVNEAVSNGLFEVSEIAFDKTGQKALVSYSFGCGELCGNGGVWRFEKVNGIWTKSKQVCGGWMS